jgi:hypothetical protein
VPSSTSTARATTTPSPGVSAAIGARNAVDEALLAIPSIPLEMDRAAIGDRLLRAVQCAYAVIDSDVLAPVHHDGLTEAAALVREARAMLVRAGDPRRAAALREALEHLDFAGATLDVGALAVAQIQFTRRSELRVAAGGAEPPQPRPFRVSIGLPVLHAFARRPLVPDVSLDPVVPIAAEASPPRPVKRPETIDALEAFAAAARSGELQRELARVDLRAPPAGEDEPLPLPYEPAIEEAEMLRRLARDCLEDIAAHRDLRKPNAIETWLDQRPFEQRLLDNIDCFAALGAPALPLVSLFFAEAKAPDPGRAFALALALGSIEGRDTIDAAVATLEHSEPETYPGWTEGFWLAPSPAIDGAMADLCTSSRPELVALALDVLFARGAAHDEVISGLLARAEPEIARRVTRALATALPRRDAMELLELRCDTADDHAFFEAIVALLRRGHGGALDRLRAAVDVSSRRSAALALLCFVGRPSDGARLLAAAISEPSATLVRGLGRFGHVDAVEVLIGLLSHEDPEIAGAAAESLDLITGAGMRETIEEPWEIELPPEAEEMGSLPVPTRKVDKLVADPARWSAWIAEHGERFERDVKYRGGAPFVPLMIVGELSSKLTPPERRFDAARELELVTGVRSCFSPDDWVVRQEAQLADLRERVAALHATPGAWAFAIGRSAGAAPARPAGTHSAAAEPPVLPSFMQAAPAPPMPGTGAPAAPVTLRTVIASPADIESTGMLPDDWMEQLAKDPLPFKQAQTAGSQMEPTAPPPAETPHVEPPAPTDVESTGMLPDDWMEQLAKGPLPFKSSPELQPPSAQEPATLSIPPLERQGPALPFQSPGGAREPDAPRAPTLTLEQYASLCAEIAVFPERANAIFQRHGLGALRDRLHVDLAWKERLRRSPAEYRQWQELYQHYKAYWIKDPRQGRQ